METLPFYQNMHHTRDQEEFEETLSLSDLTLFGDYQSDEWELDLSTQDSTSVSSSENDFFEFSSQAYFNPFSTPPENIIFCGKLIPCKQPYSFAASGKQESHTEKDRNLGHSRLSFGSRIDSKSDKQSGIPKSHEQKKDKQRPVSKPSQNSSTKAHRRDFPVQRFPIMACSSSGKAKSYLLLFGISRFSSAMELKGMKSRRSRRQNPPPAFSFRSGDKSERDSGRRLWGLIGALSCGGHRPADAMVAASIGRAVLK